MSDTVLPIPDLNLSQPAVYEIRLQGHLGDQWTCWFEGATITHKEIGDTILLCSVVDQAALHGLLKKIRDLGLPLRSVMFVEPHPTDEENRTSQKQEAVGEIY